MIYVTKFRANDLNPSKGKQIEFNSGVIENFFQFTTPQAYAEFKCISLENSSIIRNVKVSFTLSPARGDYKVYQNADGSMDLKDFFLDVLHLTREANIDDYYAIRKTPADRYTLYYIPKSLIFSAFFDKISGDQVIYFDDAPDSEGAGGIDEGKIGDGIRNAPAQKIFYGCPGTGKSYKVKDIAEGVKDSSHPEDGWKVIYYEKATAEDKTCPKVDNPTEEQKKNLTTNIFRTTFHPDYDYATFVGCYKPVKEPTGLDYKFVPQVFTNAYICALRHPEDPIYLIIEEINRGNCAQIFGDLFQLLDRTDGESDYSIKPDTELSKYLKSEEVDSERLSLPKNLHIYATMNTSDQSLFPMDSAFKRRWEMEYVPINYEQERASKFLIKVGSSLYSWTRFIEIVNELILDATESEDKQLGEFFIKARDARDGENDKFKYIDTELFTNKVMFFLWNDVCKDLYHPTRVAAPFFLRIVNPGEKENDYFTFAELYSKRNNKDRLLHEFMSYLENRCYEKHPERKVKGVSWLMASPIVETSAATE